MTEKQATEKLLDWWRKQIGYHEGANNWTKYAEDTAIAKLYGWKPQNQPWCDIIYDEGMIECFGLTAASQMTYQPIGRGSALCRTSAQYYKNNKSWYGSPQPGDQIFFFADGEINHTGIVESVSGGVVHTIEGNSSDKVARRAYATGAKNIAGYGRPKWGVVDDGGKSDEIVVKEPVKIECLPTLRKGSKGEVVKAAQFLLNGRGASVGIWGADGDFGNGTESAVLAFQRRSNLDADGIIGSITWAYLLGLG